MYLTEHWKIFSHSCPKAETHVQSTATWLPQGFVTALLIAFFLFDC
jgi:hypothetical protein